MSAPENDAYDTFNQMSSNIRLSNNIEVNY